MRRTTIFLPEETHRRLRQQAFDAQISMAELIRSRLEENAARRHKAVVDPLDRVEGIVSDGTLSLGIDEALYGE